MDNTQSEIKKILSETVRDVGSYPKAILRLGANLQREQLVFLWKRALDDLRSDDTEFAWFAQFSLRNLASIFPFDLRIELITDELVQEFNSAMKTRQDVIASIIFSKSQAVSRPERIKLQLEAVEHFYTIRKDLGRAYPHLNDNLVEWIQDNGSSLENDVIWTIWKQCTKIALTGMPSEKPDFYKLIKKLAKIIPVENIDEACLDCHGFYQSVSFGVDEPAEAIRILLLRSSHLPINARDYYYKLALEKEIQWNPKFENIWKRINSQN